MTTVRSTVEITNLPMSGHGLIQASMSAEELFAVMNFCYMCQSATQYKQSDYFKRCAVYSTQTCFQTGQKLVTSFKLDNKDENVPTFLTDCPSDTQVECVFVVGVTHDLKYHDIAVPKHVWQSWETVTC
jgi:hypothetical protein